MNPTRRRLLQPGHQLTALELRTHAKTRIVGYRSPRTAEFVDAMPVSAAGNILKTELRKMHVTEGERQAR